MRIDALFDRLAGMFGIEEVGGDGGRPNEVVRPPSGYARVWVGEYGSDGGDGRSSIVAVSRHFVTKPLYRITASFGGVARSVTTTNDHTCAVYGDGGEVLFKAAKELRVGDRVPVRDGDSDASAKVESVEEIDNSEGRFVYDMEVESGRHVYFADGVLVHNSQFINLSPVTKTKCREAGIPESTRFSALPAEVRESVVKDAYKILDAVNENVKTLIGNACHTSQGSVVHYSLEYVAAEGFYFKPKHYIVHKVIEDGRPCDKFKYSGISVKKAEIPAEMKTFLKDIYEHTMTDDWRESDYAKRVGDAFNRYMSLDWNGLAYYRKYRTPKDAVSLTESEKGAGAHARAVNIYNGILKELGLGGKYPEISVGDEFRYSYVLPTNRYGVDVIGFKGAFPKEFRDIFSPDYITMFNKIFTKSLENYVNIMGYERIDPSKRTEDPSFDIF